MIISFSTQVSLGASVWRPSRQFWGATLLHRISKCVFCRLRLKSTTPSQLVTLNLAAAIWKQIKPLSFRCVSPFLKTVMYKKYVEKYNVWKSFYGLLGEGVFTANPPINIKKVAKKIYYSLVNIVMFLLPGAMIISNRSIFCFCLKWKNPDQMVVRWPYMVLSYQDVHKLNKCLSTQTRRNFAG